MITKEMLAELIVETKENDGWSEFATIFGLLHRKSVNINFALNSMMLALNLKTKCRHLPVQSSLTITYDDNRGKNRISAICQTCGAIMKFYEE